MFPTTRAGLPVQKRLSWTAGTFLFSTMFQILYQLSPNNFQCFPQPELGYLYKRGELNSGNLSESGTSVASLLRRSRLTPTQLLAGEGEWTWWSWWSPPSSASSSSSPSSSFLPSDYRRCHPHCYCGHCQEAWVQCWRELATKLCLRPDRLGLVSRDILYWSCEKRYLFIGQGLLVIFHW